MSGSSTATDSDAEASDLEDVWRSSSLLPEGTSMVSLQMPDLPPLLRHIRPDLLHPRHARHVFNAS